MDTLLTWWMDTRSYPRFRDELGYAGPGFDESIRQKTQIILANSHSVTHEPQPLLENVVHVGGLHIRPTKPLPPDLQAYLDSCSEGAVLVSFGSSITPSSMTDAKRREFIAAFAALNNRIIWKWDTAASDDIPENVLVRDWLPQQDLLAHPNLKVFVSHGGLLSVMESVYHATILVGIPLANDQKPNLVRVQDKNIGIMLDWDTIDAGRLVEAINRALTDAGMAESIRQQSRLFRDRPEPPVKTAAWWIEFVLRNNGTQFLMPRSMDLSWVQAWNLDILAAGLLILSLGALISYKLLRFSIAFVCKCCKSQKMKHD